MKQFPYAQQIIWENDVEQIEWVDDVGNYVWYSAIYVAETRTHGFTVIGRWKLYQDDNTLLFSTDTNTYDVEDLVCWAKI